MPYYQGYEKAAHLYDIFDRKPNIDFFYQYAKDSGEILDIGAGTGRIAIPMAEKGICVFCVEPSPAMMREFRKKLKKKPELAQKIRLTKGDASTFHFDRTFSAAFMSGSFDHFMNDEQRIAALKNIHNHLEPQGKLVFDLFLGLMKDTPLSPAGNVTIGNREYRRFIEDHVRDDCTKETILIYEIYENGELLDKIEQKSVCGLTDYADLHRLLDETGFDVVNEFSDYEFHDYQHGDALLIVEAEKIADS